MVNIEGLCIIPEGRSNKDIDQEQRAEIYNVSVISNLKSYLDYADINNLGTLYISIKYGLIYADDFVTQSSLRLYELSLPKIKLWSKVIAEQIFRECLNQCVSKVHLMIESKSLYSHLIQELKSRGVNVILPLIKGRRKCKKNTR